MDVSGNTARSRWRPYLDLAWAAICSMSPASCSSRLLKPGYGPQKDCMTVPTITLRGRAPEVVLGRLSMPAASAGAAGASVAAPNVPRKVRRFIERLSWLLILDGA